MSDDLPSEMTGVENCRQQSTTKGIIALIIANLVITVFLTSLVTVVVLPIIPWQPVGGFRDFPVSNYMRLFATTGIAAQVLAGMILAGMWRQPRLLGITTACFVALVAGFIVLVTFSFWTRMQFWMGVRMPILLDIPATKLLTDYFSILRVFIVVQGIRIFLGWRVVQDWRNTTRERNRISILDLIEWITSIGVFLAIAKARGEFESRWLLSWIRSLTELSVVSLPLALGILADSRHWWKSILFAAVFVPIVVVLHEVALGQGTLDVEFAGNACVISVAYISFISLNFLALRQFGYRLIVPARQTQVAAN
jgi:hypothetical protein